MENGTAKKERRKAVKVRLTDHAIKTLKTPSDGAKFIYDSEVPYFGLRCMASGVKTFIYGYRNLEGRLHRVTLGRWPTLTATAARLRAREMAAQIAAGKDPYEERQERRTAETFKELVDLYCARHLSNLRTGDQTERFLRREAIPWFGQNAKAVTIKRRDIIRLVEEKAVEAPVSANRLLTAMKRLGNWAVQRDLLDVNPAAGIRRPTAEKSRDRVLGEDEIRIFWERVPTRMRMSESVRVALRLILILGQRPGETCSMEWAELDLKRGWWELPREKTKSDRVHRVPLTALAIEQITNQPQGDRWVFPSMNGQPLKRLALSHAIRRNLEHFGLERWTPHDLRRSCASHLAAVGVDRFIIERILNHSDNTVGGIYDRYSYDDQKRRALEKWERKLRSIIGTPPAAKVVSIR